MAILPDRPRRIRRYHYVYGDLVPEPRSDAPGIVVLDAPPGGWPRVHDEGCRLATDHEGDCSADEYGDHDDV